MRARLDPPPFRFGGGSHHIPKVLVLIFPKSFFLNYFFRFYQTHLECRTPLGMQSLAIADAQISVSSEYNVSYAACHARLYYKGGWVAATSDENQWLEVDMESQSTRVTRISIQRAHGDASGPEWVTSYQLQFSSDGVSFQNYIERENANSTVSN